MKAYIRRWTGLGTYERVGELQIGAYNGVSFRQMDEEPATAVNFKGLRVTEIYLNVEQDALNVYVEEVKG